LWDCACPFKYGGSTKRAILHFHTWHAAALPQPSTNGCDTKEWQTLMK
jgi:hypothetical protein